MKKNQIIEANRLRVFISYSTSDLELAVRAAEGISHLADVRFWERNKEPGQEDWKSIFGWIDLADVVLVLISDETIKRAMSVGQEVGRAQGAKKLIIPLVSKRVPFTELGCLKGITAIRYDAENVTAALREVQQAVSNQAENKRRANEVKTLVAIGSVLLLLLAGSEG